MRPGFSIGIRALCFAWLAVSLCWGAPVRADEPPPWQAEATGMATQMHPDQKTAGLGFVVQARDWPFLSLRGGVADAGSYGGSSLKGPIGIELGEIRVPGRAGSFSSESADWAHATLTFTTGASEDLSLWVSRLSPAVLLHAPVGALTLFAGAVAGHSFDGTTVRALPTGPAFPRYVAFPSAQGVQIRPLTSGNIDLSAANDNWMLVWYGRDSHFVHTQMPLSYLWAVPHQRAYQGDVPLLFVFEDRPASIQHAATGGVTLTFADGEAGYMALLPLYGQDVLRATETEGWDQALPGDVAQRIDWWASHLCDYPVTVQESYAYDGRVDRVAVTEQFTFLTFCPGGTRFAPLPPWLGLVKDAIAMTFSGSVVDGALATEFGPSLGIENTDHYTWYVTGLSRYIDSRRIILETSVAPPALEARLTSEVQKIVDAGHFAPWIFLDAIPVQNHQGDLYWGNPADTLFQLLEIAAVMESGPLKDDLIAYIQMERETYPPETVYRLAIDEGTLRGPYAIMSEKISYHWDPNGTRADVFLNDVPLYSFYALARYYEMMDEPVPAEVWTAAELALSRELQEHDWSTFYWFERFDDRHIAVNNANRLFAGLIGYIRLARMVEDQEAETVGRALLARVAVLRLGMANYPRYRYAAGLTEIPEDPAWQPNSILHPNLGYIYNYNWHGPFDDARQVGKLDQFKVYLHDHSGADPEADGFGSGDPRNISVHLTGYRDLTPELGRLLADDVYQDTIAHIKVVGTSIPNWYVAFAEATLGREHNLSHPINAFQLFIAKAWIERVSPDMLASYLDIPWLEAGDLFYVHKLAETIKAYRGVLWEDTVALSVDVGNQRLDLLWHIYTSLPVGTTWHIEYVGPTGDQPSPITGLARDTRTYSLSGLTNYTPYTITVSARVTERVLLSSNPVTATPTDRMIYLPFILRER